MFLHNIHCIDHDEAIFTTITTSTKNIESSAELLRLVTDALMYPENQRSADPEQIVTKTLIDHLRI
jgi:hypothetical protein